jgi:D-aspartate ligase
VGRAGRQGHDACVVGGIELVRALGAAGVRPTVIAAPASRARHSRFASACIDPAGRPLTDVLAEYAAGRAHPPALFFDSDAVLLEVSRGRQRLTGLRFVMPGAELVEDLVDKARFQQLADRLGLPVPPARLVKPLTEEPELDLRFPLILKAVPYRTDAWTAIGAGAKAVGAEDAEALRAMWPRLRATGCEFLAQELVAGHEQQIVSYHVYVDSHGQVAGEFTGRKIRTHPAEFGMSSALVTTDDPEVARIGRELVERIGLLGPAKLDFKRAPDGRLYLFEVNARFTLWVHPGALAGVNLAAVAYADLAGLPRPAVGRARPGVRWIEPRSDLQAARAAGVPLRRWIRWALTCESNPSFDWNDPGPLARRAVSAGRGLIARAGR